MWLRSVWVEGTLKVMAAVVVTAATMGAGAAHYLRPPVPEKPTGEGAQILSEDPGRAQWREVIAQLGGLGSTFVIPLAVQRQAAPPPARYYAASDDLDYERLGADIDAQMREAEMRQARWSQENDWDRQREAMAAMGQMDRAAWEGRTYAYAYAPAPAEAQPVRRYTSYGYATPEPQYVEQLRYGSRYAYRAPDAYDDEPVPPPPPVPSGW